ASRPSPPATGFLWASLAAVLAAGATAEGPPAAARAPIDLGGVGIVVQGSDSLPPDLRSRSAAAPCSVLIRIGADTLAAPEPIDPLLEAAARAGLRVAIHLPLPGRERATPAEVDAWAMRAGP